MLCYEPLPFSLLSQRELRLTACRGKNSTPPLLLQLARFYRRERRIPREPDERDRVPLAPEGLFIEFLYEFRPLDRRAAPVKCEPGAVCAAVTRPCDNRREIIRENSVRHSQLAARESVEFYTLNPPLRGGLSRIIIINDGGADTLIGPTSS